MLSAVYWWCQWVFSNPTRSLSTSRLVHVAVSRDTTQPTQREQQVKKHAIFQGVQKGWGRTGGCSVAYDSTLTPLVMFDGVLQSTGQQDAVVAQMARRRGRG